MKNFMILFGCMATALIGIGCNNTFPDSLVGHWKSDTSNLEITFAPGGEIASIRHSFGMVIDMNQGTFHEEGIDNLTADYILGPYDVIYTKKDRKLYVKIIMEYFRMELPTGILEGKIFDEFDGSVSEDGNTWNVGWKNYGNIVGADQWPDPDKVTPVPLVFRKIKAPVKADAPPQKTKTPQ